jgi:FkbM family methyltransferase
MAVVDRAATRAGRQIGGVPVVSLRDAKEGLCAHANVVVAVWNPCSEGFTVIAETLDSAGAASVLPYQVVADALPGLLPHYCLDHTDALLAAADRVRAAYSSLNDRASRWTFAREIAWRLGRHGAWFRRPCPDQYFAFDLYRPLVESEVVVDCGAFDGDTLREVVNRWKTFTAYYAFEPDGLTVQELRATVATLPRGVREKVTIWRAATAGTSGEARFAPGGTGGKLDAAGGERVAQVRLDDAVLDPAPTLFKADVEGAELETLGGARALISSSRPVLAVSAYHRPEDLWEVPLYCREAWPDFSLHLRMHATDGWETVLYAVPPERRP